MYRKTYPVHVSLEARQPVVLNTFRESPAKGGYESGLCLLEGFATTHDKCVAHGYNTEITHLSSACRKETRSSMRRALTWSRFFVTQRTTLPSGSTSDSSITQLSAFLIIPCGAHRGSVPFLRSSRVVTSEPEDVISREITSHARIWVAYGLGYRKKKANATVDQGSL